MAFLDSFKKIFSSREGDDRTALARKIKASPNDPQLRQKLALILLKQREVVEGLAELAKAAELYEKDGFEGKSVAVLRQMLKYDIDNLDVQQRLICLLAKQGLHGDARGEFEKVISGGLARAGDEQRLSFLAGVAESLPATPLPRLLIADTLIAKNKVFEAESELAKAAGPSVESGMTGAFVERLQKLVAAVGDNVEHLEPCGFLWLRIGRTAEGNALLSRVAARMGDEGNAERSALAERVLAAIHDGWSVVGAEVLSFRDAARVLDAPEASRPAAPTPSPVREREKAPAEGQGQAVPAAEEEDAEEAGMVRDALGRLQAKVDEEIGDTDLEARYNLGIAYKEMGLLDEAVAEFRKAAARPDLFVGASTLVADILADKGDVDGAIAALDDLLGSGLSASDARDVRYHKGALLERAGRTEEAREVFAAIQAENPSYRDVKARLERLR